MSIFNFIEQSDLDELDEDSRTAFMQLANMALRSLRDQVDNLDLNDQQDWNEDQNLRFSCMNVLLAAAKKLDVEPFSLWDKPARADFGETEWRDFQSDIEAFITQVVLDNSAINRSNSVSMLPRTKDEIRGYINGLRECIEKANMDRSKREALLKKLDALQQELEKRRISMIAVAKIVYHLWAVPGSMWASYDIANKLLSNVMHSIAEAKADENELKRLAAPEPTKAIAPPQTSSARPSSRSAKSMQTDGELPF